MSIVFSRKQRIAVCADYLLGLKIEYICRKHLVSDYVIYHWLYKVRNHFQLRKKVKRYRYRNG